MCHYNVPPLPTCLGGVLLRIEVGQSTLHVIDCSSNSLIGTTLKNRGPNIRATIHWTITG